jgi:hypothetical protein
VGGFFFYPGNEKCKAVMRVMKHRKEEKDRRSVGRWKAREWKEVQSSQEDITIVRIVSRRLPCQGHD